MDLLRRSLTYKDAETWAHRRGSCRGPILVDAETWIRRHGSCRESWDTKMLRLRRHGSCRGSWDINECWDMNAKTWIGHMDLAQDPETRRCWDMNPKTWILQRTLRYKDAETWIGDMDLAEDPEIHTDPETWILQRFLRYMWMLRHESGNMDLAEDPEIHMNAYIWIRRHGSCRGSWDTYGCWDMNPETDLAEVPEIHMDAETWIRRQILQRILRVTYFWVLIYGSGDMDLAEEPAIRRCWDMNPKTWILQGPWGI